MTFNNRMGKLVNSCGGILGSSEGGAVKWWLECVKYGTHAQCRHVVVCKDAAQALIKLVSFRRHWS